MIELGLDILITKQEEIFPIKIIESPLMFCIICSAKENESNKNCSMHQMSIPKVFTKFNPKNH